MKIQLWICIWFLFDFVLEFFLKKAIVSEQASGGLQLSHPAMLINEL